MESLPKEIEHCGRGNERGKQDCYWTQREDICSAKAVILLCECRKNRDADHLQNFIYDRKDIDIEKWISDVRRYPIPIPDYTFDVHTRKGKKHGRTKEEFFQEEYKALQPRVPGLFDDLVQPSQPKLFNDETTAK